MSIERREDKAEKRLSLRLPKKYFAYKFKAIPRNMLIIVDGNERFYKEYVHHHWHDIPPKD